MDGIKIEKSERIKASQEWTEIIIKLDEFLEQQKIKENQENLPAGADITGHTPAGRLAASREAERIRQEKGK